MGEEPAEVEVAVVEAVAEIIESEQCFKVAERAVADLGRGVAPAVVLARWVWANTQCHWVVGRWTDGLEEAVDHVVVVYTGLQLEKATEVDAWQYQIPQTYCNISWLGSVILEGLSGSGRLRYHFVM